MIRTATSSPSVSSSTFHMVKDAVGNITLQPPTDDEQRAVAFRKEIESWIDLARDAADPVREWFDIGPLEARVLLEYSDGNRNEPAPVVAMLARDIIGKQWHQHHQGMGFARSGWFADGHHRCLGIIESGGTVRIAIDFGVADQGLRFADMGRARSISDQLAFTQELKNGKKTVAAMRVCLALCEGKDYLQKRSLAEIRAALVEHKAAVRALAMLAHARFPGAFWGAMIYAYPSAPLAIEALAEKIIHAEGIEGTAFALREYLLRTRDRSEAAALRIAHHTLIAIRAVLEQRVLARIVAADYDAVLTWFAAKKQVQ